MVLLASDYDKSKYLKAEDVPREKKFRIKSWTEDIVGMDRDKEKKLVIWSQMMNAVWWSTKPITGQSAAHSAIPLMAGSENHRDFSGDGGLSRHDEDRSAGAHPAVKTGSAGGCAAEAGGSVRQWCDGSVASASGAGRGRSGTRAGSDKAVG
jgi:hypothetical protein